MKLSLFGVLVGIVQKKYPMNILLVDDNPPFAKAVQAILRGNKIAWCTRLETALWRLKDETYDLILLDLILDDSGLMQTLSAIPKIKRLHKEKRIIIVTGSDELNGYPEYAGCAVLKKGTKFRERLLAEVKKVKG